MMTILPGNRAWLSNKVTHEMKQKEHKKLL